MAPSRHHRLQFTVIAACVCTVVLAVLATTAAAAAAADAPRNAVYLETAGNGGVISLNYERFVAPSLSLRGGAGFLWVWPSVPLTANWYVGNGTHRLELGVGATIFFAPSEDKDDADFLEDLVEKILLAEGAGTQVVGTATVGYRLTSGRFVMRAGFTPFFKSDVFAPWGGLSLGVAF